MPGLKLYEFPVSHYCEKVRWALDYKRLPYERKLLVPVLHIPIVLALTRQTKVPVLECDGEKIVNSPDILTWLEARYPDTAPLYPEDATQCARAIELMALFDQEIGPHVQRVAYYHTINDKAFMHELLTLEQPFVNRKLLIASLPVILRVMQKGMGINDANYQKSLNKLNGILERIDSLLTPSGYLMGDAFSVADLAAASLLAPLVQPENSFYALPTTPSESLQALKDSYRDRPFFQWVNEIYRKHR